MEETVPHSFRRDKPPNRKTIYAKCLKIAIPSSAESLFQSVIACADTMMVGVLGASAISAVGIGSQVKFLLMAVIYALNASIVAVIARRKGSGEELSLYRCFGYALSFALALSVLMSILGYFFVDEILRLLGAAPDYAADAVLFVRWLLLGNIFSALSMAINSALRGIGNANVSLFSNVTANMVNIAMNYCLISGHLGFPAMGIKGAAIATVLGNLASLLISLYYVIGKNRELSLRKIPSLSLNKRDLKAFGIVGSGALVEQVFTRIGYMTYAGIVARLGTIAFAAHSICLNLVDITFMLGSGVGSAASVTVGQSLGAEKKDAAIMSRHACQRLAFLASLFIALPFLLFPESILSLFNKDPEVIAAGSSVMFLLAACSLLQPQMLVLSGSLRGAGDSRFVALSTLISLTFIRPLMAWVCCYPLGLGLMGAWLAMIADHVIRTFLNACRCRGSKWLEIRI